MYISKNYTVSKRVYNFKRKRIRKKPQVIMVEASDAYSALLGVMSDDSSILDKREIPFQAMAAKGAHTGIILRGDGLVLVYDVYPNVVMIL